MKKSIKKIFIINKKFFLTRLISILICLSSFNNICMSQEYGLEKALINYDSDKNNLDSIDDYRFLYDMSPELNINIIFAIFSIGPLFLSIYKKNLFNNKEIGPKQKSFIIDCTILTFVLYSSYKFHNINIHYLDWQSLKEQLFQKSEIKDLISRIISCTANNLSLFNLMYKTLKNANIVLEQKTFIDKKLLTPKTSCGICFNTKKELKTKKFLTICDNKGANVKDNMNDVLHIFCYDCLVEWAKEKGAIDFDCPLCRQKVNGENTQVKISCSKNYNFKDIVLKNPCYSIMIVILTLIIINELRDLVVNF